MKSLLTLLVALILGLGWAGCDEADNAVDCFEICNHYNDCVDGDVAEAECTEQCSDQANSNENYEDDLEACSDCLDDNDDSCMDSGICVAECAVVVPAAIE